MKTGLRTFVAIISAAALISGILCCKKEAARISIELSNDVILVSEGDTVHLSAKVLPEGSDQSVKWRSLDGDIATVDASGCIYGVSGGQTMVIASQGEVNRGCRVNVISHVTGVKLDIHEKQIEIDGIFQLKAQVQPSVAYNDTVIWSSTAPDVAVVGNGIVTGLKVGKADIVVTTKEGGYTDTCHVEVISPVKEVKINKSSTRINVGETEKLTVTITPETATYKDVAWRSDDTAVAEVAADGTVTGIGKGNCTIFATAVNGGACDSCKVEIYSPVTGVSIPQETLQMYVGDRITMKAEIQPADANNQIVTWSSDASSVATIVMATGVVTAKKEGTAVITVKTQEGSFTDQCTITVIQGTKEVTGISLDKESLRLRVGGTYELYASVLPVDAREKGVTWSSSASTTASVDSYGKVTAKDAGTCTITATTKEGGFSASCTVTIVGFDTGTDGLDETGYVWED